MPLFGKQGRDLGPAPSLSIADMQRLIAEAQSNSLGSGSTMWAGEGEGSSLLDFSGGIVPQLQGILDYMTQNGLTNTDQVPEAYKRFLVPQKQDKTLADQFAAYITNPAVLTAIGGVAGVYSAPANAAGAAAGEGAYGAGYGVGNATTAAPATTGGAASTVPAGSFQTASANTGTMTDVGTGGLFETGGGEMLGGVGGAEEAGLAAYTNIGGGAAPAAAGTYQFPYGDVLKGALGLYLNNKQAKDLKGIASNAAAISDPFAAERPRYQAQFQDLTTTPSNFFQDPAISGAIGHQQDVTSRRLASQGYNMSGNFANEVAKTGMNEAFKQYMPYSNMIGQAAGAFQGTQGAGTAYAGPATAANTAQGRTDAGTLAILEQIYRGQQPTSAQQATGTPKNQNALEGIFSL